MIYRPLKTNWITQAYGENRACIKTRVNGSIVYPTTIVSKNKVCPIGFKDFYKAIGYKGHTGQDNSAWHREGIYFPADYVSKWYAMNEIDRDGGIGVDIISESPVLDGKHIKLRFWHLDASLVYDGQSVVFGQKIGLAGNTGASSGTHLHWSMKFVDKDGQTIDRDNGYAGAVDFAPYHDNVFVLDVLDLKEKALTVIDLGRKVIKEVQIFINKLK